jgi:hypothetical protein
MSCLMRTGHTGQQNAMRANFLKNDKIECAKVAVLSTFAAK